MTTRLILSLALAGGCTIGDGLTDEEQGLPLDANQNPATSTEDTEICPAEDLTATCDGPAGQGSALTLTGGVGRVDAVHTGVDLPDCATWTALAVPGAPFEIDVTYEAEGTTTCADECGWTFTWWVALDPGEWTFDVMGDVATVTVR